MNALNTVAGVRGQSLSQLALAWTLRDSPVTSALIGASSTKQLEQAVKALDGPALSHDDLRSIDEILARSSSEAGKA